MLLADRISRLQPSPIREILNVVDKPGMISFAGGLPSSDSFPCISVSDLDHRQLQYGATEGDADLREFVAKDLANRGLHVSADQVLILSGSQQGIDLVAKLMIENGTQVAVESPTYLAALQVFSLFGAEYQPFTPATTNLLINCKNAPALTYTVPTFQNPTGHCYTTDQRKALAKACDMNGSVLFEDDPYRELAYDDCDRRPVCSFMQQQNWIYQSSFSKTLAPGLRLGYLVCSAQLYPALSWLKQAADLHSNRLSQHIVLEQLQAGNAGERMVSVVAGYQRKRDVFAAALEKHLYNLATWQVPSGGLFFWLRLLSDNPVDTQKLLAKAIECNVAFMPGEPFFPAHDDESSYIRLNFSHAGDDEIAKGLQTLSTLISAELD